jgi:hypothetical protein
MFLNNKASYEKKIPACALLIRAHSCFLYIFAAHKTVVVAQLVRASDCGSEGRRFEPGHPPYLARYY